MRKLVLAVLLVSTLLLSACGPAVKPAAGPVTEGGEVFTVALPRVVVDYDLQGNPSIQGLDLAYLDRITGTNLTGNLRLPPGYATWMQTANVQHIEIRQAGNGVNVFVNGKAMPYLAWDDDSLQKTSALLAIFSGPGQQLDVQFLGRLMPIVRRLGLDLALRFPRQPNTAEIALADLNTSGQQLATKASGTPAFAILQFEVKYDDNGIPAVLGVTARDLAQRGLLPVSNYALDRSVIARLQAANIQSLELRAKEDGLYMYVNGQPLPNIVWDDTFLQNMAQVYGQMNDQSDRNVFFVTQALPWINKADVGVLIHFPVAQGQQPIAAKMH